MIANLVADKRHNRLQLFLGEIVYAHLHYLVRRCRSGNRLGCPIDRLVVVKLAATLLAAHCAILYL